MILCIPVVSVVTSYFSFLMWMIWVLSHFSWWVWLNVYNLIFSNKQLLVSLIFAIVFFVSISFISIMIFMFSFLLLFSVKGNYWNFPVLSLITLCIKLLLLFSHPVVSNSLGPHGLEHVRPPCPSPSAGVFPSSRALHWWCHPAISSSDAVFSFCPQSFPASGTFLVSQLFTSGD